MPCSCWRQECSAYFTTDDAANPANVVEHLGVDTERRREGSSVDMRLRRRGVDRHDPNGPCV